jgi:hypothetical protein
MMRAEHPNPARLAVGLVAAEGGKWRVNLLEDGTGAHVPIELDDYDYARGFAAGIALAMGLEVQEIAL